MNDCKCFVFQHCVWVKSRDGLTIRCGILRGRQNLPFLRNLLERECARLWNQFSGVFRGQFGPIFRWYQSLILVHGNRLDPRFLSWKFFQSQQSIVLASRRVIEVPLTRYWFHSTGKVGQFRPIRGLSRTLDCLI